MTFLTDKDLESGIWNLESGIWNLHFLRTGTREGKGGGRRQWPFLHSPLPDHMFGFPLFADNRPVDDIK